MIVVMAASNVGVAAIAASAALAGVLLGGFVDYAIEGLRVRTRARAGARLVRVDLLNAGFRLREAQQRRVWFRFFELPMESWDDYRDVLAMRLSHEQWETVATSVTHLRQIDSSLRRYPEFEAGKKSVELTDDVEKQVRDIRCGARDAFDALAGLAGARGERSDGGKAPWGDLE